MKRNRLKITMESRIHGDVYVRFGGRLSETYHRKVAWRRQPSLQITKEKLSKDVEKLSQQINNIEEFTFGNVCNDNTNTINGRV